MTNDVGLSPIYGSNFYVDIGVILIINIFMLVLILYSIYVRYKQ